MDQRNGFLGSQACHKNGEPTQTLDEWAQIKKNTKTFLPLGKAPFAALLIQRRPKSGLELVHNSGDHARVGHPGPVVAVLNRTQGRTQP